MTTNGTSSAGNKAKQQPQQQHHHDDDIMNNIDPIEIILDPRIDTGPVSLTAALAPAHNTKDMEAPWKERVFISG